LTVFSSELADNLTQVFNTTWNVWPVVRTKMPGLWTNSCSNYARPVFV